MDYSDNQLLTKKNLLTLLLLAVLMVAIPLGVKLAQQTQVFKSRAALAPPIQFQGAGGANTVTCTGNSCVTTSPAIDIQITSPIGPPQGVQSN